MPIIDNEFVSKRDSHESLFTILVYNTNCDFIITDLTQKLKKIKEISNGFKKNKLSQRVHNLLLEIEKKSIQIYNHIILVGDNIEYIKLNSTDIKTLNDYSIPKYTFEYGEYFNIKWLTDIFNNFEFYDIINIKTQTHIKGNMNKHCTVSHISNSQIFIEYISQLQNEWIMIGDTNPKINIKNLILTNKNIITHIPKFTTWFNIIEQINKFENSKNINKLALDIKKMSQNSDKYVFGNKIYEAIESYSIQSLYVHSNIKNKFDLEIEEQNIHANINFNILIIDTLKDEYNISDILLNSFGGIIGIKYY